MEKGLGKIVGNNFLGQEGDLVAINLKQDGYMIVPDVNRLHWFEFIEAEGRKSPYKFIYGRIQEVNDEGVWVEFIGGDDPNINCAGIFILRNVINSYRILVPK